VTLTKNVVFKYLKLGSISILCAEWCWCRFQLRNSHPYCVTINEWYECH